MAILAPEVSIGYVFFLGLKAAAWSVRKGPVTKHGQPTNLASLMLIRENMATIEGHSSDEQPTRLRGRMWTFYDCIDLGNDNHVGGWRYNLVELKRCAPPRSLMVRWIDKRSKRLAVRVQSEVFYAYVREHCELPPLNYSLGRELMKKSGWRLVRELA
jgi:hypothetical protein